MYAATLLGLSWTTSSGQMAITPDSVSHMSTTKITRKDTSKTPSIGILILSGQEISQRKHGIKLWVNIRNKTSDFI
jgi:hypothetical protein